MPEQPEPPLEVAETSSLADGEWHRLHPLTPLLKGGIVLLILAGIIITNMRDRIVSWFLENSMLGDSDYYGDYESDPIDWLVSNNLLLVGSLIALGLVVVLCAIFYVFWRFHTFRITGENVEVRKGIVFRSHRRAPLDRVQGVNLTRPFPARLIGMAKLEVVGAGTGANVPLEYLSTARAEAVRADILQLASGARRAKQIARGDIAPDAAHGLVDTVSAGVSAFIEGVDMSDVAAASVVKIPAGRIVGSQLLNVAPWFLLGLFFTAAIVMMPILFADGSGRVTAALVTALAVGVPLVLAFTAVTWALISRSLRYAIAPTPDGVRTTYGLFTTVTETLPPGRVHALEISQPLLWRPFNWWTVKINRLTGASAVQAQSSTQQQFNIALPVGTPYDVARVLELMLPDLPASDLPLVYEHGIYGPAEHDAYRTIKKGAGWRRPVSARRHGFVLTDFALMLRRGRIWRKLAIFPLARLQSFAIEQGPIDRLQNVAAANAHAITGPVTGQVVGIEREIMQQLLDAVSRGAAIAASLDTSHRWAEVVEAHAAAVREGRLVPGGAPVVPEPGAAVDVGMVPPALPVTQVAPVPPVPSVPTATPTPPVPPAGTEGPEHTP